MLWLSRALASKEASLEIESFKVVDVENYLIEPDDLFGRLQDIPPGEKVSFNAAP